jgi:hypothetical protein
MYLSLRLWPKNYGLHDLRRYPQQRSQIDPNYIARYWVDVSTVEGIGISFLLGPHGDLVAP